MEIYDKGADSVEVLGAGTFFKGLWLPTDKTQRPKIRNDQVLEIRRAHQSCRDFNVLVTYGNLCDQYEKVVEHIEHLLLVYKHDSTRVEDKQKAIEYILKWFMARVQDKEVQAPRKARQTLAEYLAKYLDNEIEGRPNMWVERRWLMEVMEQGITAYESIEDCQVVVLDIDGKVVARAKGDKQ